MAKIFLGVDPGSVSGAWAVLDWQGKAVLAADLPVADKMVNAAAWNADLSALSEGDVVAIVERVGPMPLQGLSSTFNFGRGYGTILGVLGARSIPVTLVAPSKWKAFYSLDKDKEKSRALATRLFPSVANQLSRKKDAGRAEALLLANYLFKHS